MTVYNASDSNPHMLVAGTRFQAPDGKIFRSNSDVTVPGAGVKGGKIAAGTAQVQVTADQNGDSYNEGPAQYSIPALGDNSMYGQGGQMSGGTSKVVKVVQQSDIDTAQKAALDKAKDDELKDLKDKFVELQAKEQIGDNNQIYDNGLGTAQVSADGKNAAGQAQFKINSSAYGGVKIDTDALAKQLSGKRYGEAVDMASKVAGVSRAEVSLWPAWATGVPHVASRVKVSVSVAAAKPNQ
jgi:hypothetical protein